MRRLASILVALALAAGCDDQEVRTAAAGGSGGAAGDSGGVDPPLLLDCDPIVPGYCGFPFPNDTWTEADPTTPTGKRVKLSQAMLPGTRAGVKPKPDDYADSDGFSPGVALLAHLPGATTAGLPTPLTIADSLKESCPTVLIDADTGAKIPHFSELDLAAKDPAEQTFMIRPVVRLKDKTRYIVGIRGVVDEAGKAIEPSPAFKALRDVEASDDPAVKGRRHRFADLLGRLEKAGVSRQNLQLAWDFTTASRENNTAAMLAMRDQALAAVGTQGPEYTIESAETDWQPETAVHIKGTMKAPLFLDKPGAGGLIKRDASGKPVQNGTADVPFLAIVPQSATKGDPASVVWYGHGLLGSREEVESFSDLAEAGRFALVASDWSGMAADDVDNIIAILTSGDIGKFRTVAERLQQGILNALLLTRMGTGRLANDPAVQFGGKSALKRDEPYFFGGSQGGIFGATYMALTTDVRRGVLAVPGQSYNLLLQRSEDFDPFFTLIKGTYASMMDIQLVMSLLQLHWDRAEPTGYSSYIHDDPLPGTPAHDVLMLVSIGDHQVTTLGAHVMARAIGAKNLRPVNRSIFGIDEVDGPRQGSSMIEFDFGLPPEPLGNVPMREGKDPHSRIKEVPSALITLGDFLRTGQAKNNCDGVCDPN